MMFDVVHKHRRFMALCSHFDLVHAEEPTRMAMSLSEIKPFVRSLHKAGYVRVDCGYIRYGDEDFDLVTVQMARQN